MCRFHEIFDPAKKIRAVARAHQLLGGFRFCLSVVIRHAAGGIFFPALAGTQRDFSLTRNPIRAPILFLLRRTRYYDIILKGGSVAIALVALVWVIERISENELGITSSVDKLVQRPRIVFLLAIAAVIAAGLRELEKRSDRLRPTHAELSNS